MGDDAGEAPRGGGAVAGPGGDRPPGVSPGVRAGVPGGAGDPAPGGVAGGGAGAPQVEVRVSDGVPPDRFVLVTGKLSISGQAELLKRVRAGEIEEHVLAELLVKEGKAVVGRMS